MQSNLLLLKANWEILGPSTPSFVPPQDRPISSRHEKGREHGMWTGTQQRAAKGYGNCSLLQDKMAAPAKIQQLLMAIAARTKATKTFDRLLKQVNMR